MDIVLEDLREDGEERVLEAADSGRVGLAGDAYRQAEGLKQVVVEVRFAGILEGTFPLLQFRFCYDTFRHTKPFRWVFTLLTKRSL